MQFEDLEKLGLTKNEAKVYLALLKLGTTTSKLIIEKTELHRQLVYDALELLIEKGLVSYVLESKRKNFKATDPKEFIELFNKRIKEIEIQKENFKKSLEELEKIKETSNEEQDATIYRGNKGIKSLLDDIIRDKKETLTIGTSDIEGEAYAYHLEFNIPQFHNVREKSKVPFKMLLSEELNERAKKLNKLQHTQVKVLPKEFTSNSSTNIYGDKISIIMWGSQPFGILIKSKEIAQSQRKHFNILWDIAKTPK